VKVPTGGKVREPEKAEPLKLRYRQYSLDERRHTMKHFSLSKISVLGRLLILAVIMAMTAGTAHSQNTTATIKGTVTESDGQALEAVSIQITDNSTGATYGATTNSYGHYSVSGLKPGTYTALFSSIGYKKAAMNGITLTASGEYALNVELEQSQVALDDVVILEKRNHFSETLTGKTYRIDNSAFSSLPSTSRSLLDFARLSPYSGNDNSMAGMDGRTTKLAIDGAIFSNTMGLSADLPGGGTPISLDAVEEMQVAVAPFDVRQSEFTGGALNVITKSGTNSFHTSIYNYFHNQDLRGNKVDGTVLGDRDKESNHVMGITIGGPIVKNRLFYFVNLERTSTPGPISEYTLSADGTGNSSQLVSRVTQQDMDKFRQALLEYGYDPGTTDLSDGGTVNDKILARLDWLVSDRHKLMVRYNLTNNSQTFGPNARSTVGSKLASDRIGDKAYAFSGNCYDINDLAWSAVAELNSSTANSNNLSNRFLATVSYVSNSRSSNSAWFPHIDIMKDGDAFMSAGYELFSNGTGNGVKTYSASNDLSWTMGHSSFVFGAAYQYQKIQTNYRMYGTGYYRYSSLDDFISQKAPVAFGLTYAFDDSSDPTSRVNYGQTAVYLQGETRIAKRLAVTYGLRADVLEFYDDYSTNQAIKSLDWTWHFNTPGTESDDYVSPVIDTGSWPVSSTQLSPRLGFNWRVLDNDIITVRGGTGLFRGRIPMVFLTCIPNSSGMLQNTITDSGSSGYLSGLEGNFLYTEESLRQYVQEHGARMQAGSGILGYGSSICAVSGDFKMPSVFKTSVAMDFKFESPVPLSFGVEGIYNKDINAVYTENWNLANINSTGHFIGYDNRADYSKIPSVQEMVSKTGGAMVLKNANMGYSWSVCASFAVNPVKNLKMELSYIHSESYTISDMHGSSLSSTWSNKPNVNTPNELVLRPSAYVIPDKVTANAVYSLDWGGSGFWGNAELGLFYAGQNAGTYSYLYANDMNGDGVNNDLIWIPEGTYDIKFTDILDANSNILYSAATQEQKFWEFVLQDEYLKSHLGEYAQANDARMPWLNRFDLHLAQNFNPGGFGLTMSVDIMNVGNLLDSSWGVAQVTSACNNGRILKYAGNSNGRPYFQLATNNGQLVTDTFEPQKSMSNCWYLQFGLKIRY